MQQSDQPAGSISPVPSDLARRGGAGLTAHRARDPFPRSLNIVVGFLAVIILLGAGVAVWAMNPAFSSGDATGTPDQVGKLASASSGPPVVQPGTPAAEGKALIGKYGCGGCHTIPGIDSAQGAVCPNLGGVASRKKIAGGAVPNNGPADLSAWIQDPPGKKPGTAMPKLGVPASDADKIAAYLELLK